MTVTYKPFNTEHGFKSPGFAVDELGNFSVASLNATGSLKIDNVDVLSTTTLASSVVNSSLTSVGTLTGLNVDSTSLIDLTTTANFNLASSALAITSSSVTISSSGAIVLTPVATGSIDNIAIGMNTPSEAQFTTVVATENVFVGNQNIKALATAFAVALS